jgi:hypothetical protein
LYFTTKISVFGPPKAGEEEREVLHPIRFAMTDQENKKLKRGCRMAAPAVFYQKKIQAGGVGNLVIHIYLQLNNLSYIKIIKLSLFSRY